MKRTAAVALALLVVLATPAPASAAANKEHLQLMAEIRMLQEQNQQLQAVLGSLTDALKAVSGKLDDQSSSARKAMADQTLAVTNMGDNVRVLREKSDETNVRISTVLQEIEALRQAIASQPPPQVAGVPPTGTDPEIAPPTAPPVSTVPPVGLSAQRMYETSYDDYTAGRYDLAVQGFEAYIQAFPRTSNAADAQYNIGMAYYNMSNAPGAVPRWGEARDAFQKVISDYPQQTNRVADAYYKLGQTFERLAQIDNARKAYETVVQKYPTTQAAALANQALQRPIMKKEDEDAEDRDD
jgi:tol-pal system protein YbgF